MPFSLKLLPLAATAADPGAGSMLPSIIMIVAMIAVFYFLMIRPENKRKKEAENMRNSLSVGDDITTIGGITGTICAVKDKTIVIETGADRVRIEFTKWAVSSKGTQTTEDVPNTEDKKDKDKNKNKAKDNKDGKDKAKEPEKDGKDSKKDK